MNYEFFEKSIYDIFLDKMEKDKTLNQALVKKIIELRNNGKISKGTNLKNLIEEFDYKKKDQKPE